MSSIVLADCAKHYIAVPTPAQADDFKCPHCRINELEAEKDDLAFIAKEQENAHVASNMQNAELKATIERVRNEVSATNTLTGREVQQCVLRVLDQK